MNILITGSSSGLGFFLAKEFCNKGEIVFLNGRDENKLKKAEKNLSSNGFIADVTDPNQADNLIKYAELNDSPLSSIICNVGSGKSLKSGKEDYQEWLRMMNINLMSTVNIINSVKKLSISKKLSIVCISSICGKESIQGAPISYSVFKAALNHFIKVSSKELYSSGVRINGVVPGNLMFKGSTWEEKVKKEKENVDKTLELTTMKRFGSTDEIFNVVEFLASSKSSFLTGSLVVADGGQTNSI